MIAKDHVVQAQRVHRVQATRYISLNFMSKSSMIRRHYKGGGLRSEDPKKIAENYKKLRKLRENCGKMRFFFLGKLGAEKITSPNQAKIEKEKIHIICGHFFFKFLIKMYFQSKNCGF